MKGLKISLSIILLYAAIGNPVKANAGWTKGNPVTLDAALLDPAHVTFLILNCDQQGIALFNSKSSLFTGLNAVQLIGGDKKTDWNKIFLAINDIPALKSVEFNSNGLSKIPDGINSLKTINSLAFSDNDKLDLEDLVTKLSDMDNIRELKLEVFAAKDLPENISDLDGLERFSIYNKEIIFGDEATKDKAEEQLKTESDFEITWYDDLNDRKKAAISYFSIGESITGTDMYTVSKLFPRTDLSSFASVNKNKKQDKWVIEKARWNKKYNFIKPPIKGVDVDKSYYIINAANGGNFTYSSGSKISIPPFAFVNANGKLVNGDVTVDYREFKDQADILASGIPMTYDSGGVMNNFESAGMFEINTSQNGNEVFLKKDKKISMDFTSNDDRSSFNLYAFNDTIGNWKIIGKAGMIKKVPVDFNATDRSDALNAFKWMLNFTDVKGFDSALFEDRFASEKYFHTMRIDPTQKSSSYRVNRKKTSRWFIKPAAVKKTKDGKTIFNIRYFSEQNPELNNFGNILWVTSESMVPGKFRKEFNARNGYSDIRIVRDGSSYEMQFKGLKGIQHIEVDPVILTKEKNTMSLSDGGSKMFKRYQKRLRARERSFNKEIKKGLMENNKYNINNRKEKEQYAWNAAKKFMSPEEKKMTCEQWIASCEANMKREKKELNGRDANESNIVRSFEVNGMGVFNCDQISRMQSPMAVKAHYRDSADKKMFVNTTYVIQKNINAVFRYGGVYSFEGKGTDIAFDTKAENTILTIGEDGSIAIFTPDKFVDEKFIQKCNHTFTMSFPDAKVSSVGDLRKLMGL